MTFTAREEASSMQVETRRDARFQTRRREKITRKSLSLIVLGKF